MSSAPTHPAEPQTSSRACVAWVVEIIVLIAVAAALFAWFNLREDTLGLHGRSPIEIYALERYSKYLMSYRYVPEHYDGILLSSSVAANWDTGQFSRYRVFNAAPPTRPLGLTIKYQEVDPVLVKEAEVKGAERERSVSPVTALPPLRPASNLTVEIPRWSRVVRKGTFCHRQ